MASGRTIHPIGIGHQWGLEKRIGVTSTPTYDELMALHAGKREAP